MTNQIRWDNIKPINPKAEAVFTVAWLLNMANRLEAENRPLHAGYLRTLAQGLKEEKGGGDDSA